MDRDELADEGEEQAFVDALIRRDTLEGPALGVAKKFVSEGSGGLSQKQKWVLREHVLEAHKVKNCAHCGVDIPWSEQLGALDNGGICGYCEHRWNKAMDEK